MFQVPMLKLQELQIPPCFNMYLVISKSITAFIPCSLSCHYLFNHSTSDTGLFQYFVVTQNKENSPKCDIFLLLHPL